MGLITDAFYESHGLVFAQIGQNKVTDAGSRDKFFGLSKNLPKTPKQTTMQAPEPAEMMENESSPCKIVQTT